MADSPDKWPLPRYDIGQPKHIHALGVVSATYNQLEFSLFCLLLDYTRLSSGTTQWLFANTANNLRLELFRRCVIELEADAATRAHMLHFADCYDRCAENRNILMHSMTGKTNDEEILNFTKASKNNARNVNTLNLRLEDTRRDGTYVAPHHRSAPDNSYNNNWNVPPNVNPFTAERRA